MKMQWQTLWQTHADMHTWAIGKRVSHSCCQRLLFSPNISFTLWDVYGHLFLCFFSVRENKLAHSSRRVMYETDVSPAGVNIIADTQTVHIPRHWVVRKTSSDWKTVERSVWKMTSGNIHTHTVSHSHPPISFVFVIDWSLLLVSWQERVEKERRKRIDRRPADNKQVTLTSRHRQSRGRGTVEEEEKASGGKKKSPHHDFWWIFSLLLVSSSSPLLPSIVWQQNLRMLMPQSFVFVFVFHCEILSKNHVDLLLQGSKEKAKQTKQKSAFIKDSEKESS